MGLVFQSVPLKELDDTVLQLTDRIKGVPKNQLMMMKMMVNQAYENMGLSSTQSIATLFDGIARHRVVPKASCLSSVRKKSALNKLLPKETPVTRFRGANTSTA